GLRAGPARAAHRACRQVAQMAVKAMRSAVEDTVSRDLRAEIPPCQAFGRFWLDRHGTLMDAAEDRGVFEAAVEERAVRALVLFRLRRQRSAERQLSQRAKATRQSGSTEIGHTPTPLQGCLAQQQSSADGDHPQFVPASLKHWCGDLNPA